MKKLSIFPLLLFFTFSSTFIFAQVEFEKGYFIDNTGEKITCLIKNYDWRYNPSAFDYKLTKDAEIITLTAKDVAEFGVENYNIYRAFTVEIDTTSDKFRNIERNVFPRVGEKDLFLKVIFSGNATLYKFQEEEYTRYFYDLDSREITPLLYNKYLGEEGEIRESSNYKNQLARNFSCAKIDSKKIQNLEYRQKSIINFLIDYHECNGYQYTIPKANFKKGKLGLTIRPSIRSSRLDVFTFGFSYNLGRKNYPSGGIELEYIFPFQKNKWSLILEPTYNSYSVDNSDTNQRVLSMVDYKSIEVPIGLRYYMFLNKTNAIFANVILGFDAALNSSTFFRHPQLMKTHKVNVSTGYSLGLGLGYRYNRFSYEVRFLSPRNIIRDNGYWRTQFSTFSFIIGYRIF